jgi:prepilin peptidase CpaA
MASHFVYSEFVLIATAAVLFYVALNDLRHYKIRNDLILVLAVLYFLHALISGRWMNAHWNLGFSLLMSGIMCFFYSCRLMGGGDVKLLGVAFLWVGIDCALPFALLLLAFSSIHILVVKLGWVDAQKTDDGERTRIAFAPSVAAALIGVFMLGCLAPMDHASAASAPWHNQTRSVRAGDIPAQKLASVATSFPIAR